MLNTKWQMAHTAKVTTAENGNERQVLTMYRC